MSGVASLNNTCTKKKGELLILDVLGEEIILGERAMIGVRLGNVILLGLQFCLGSCTMGVYNRNSIYTEEKAGEQPL